MKINEQEIVRGDGSLHQNLDGYIAWKVGDDCIVLDGEFTIENLQWLINYLKKNETQ